MITKLNVVKWYLLELAESDPDDIEGNDFDIYGEDEQGMDGVLTVEITDIARMALNKINRLQKENIILRRGMKGDYDLDAWLDWVNKYEFTRSSPPEAIKDKPDDKRLVLPVQTECVVSLSEIKKAVKSVCAKRLRND